MGEITPFLVWIIRFPELKINFETLGTYEKHLEKKFFDQRFGSGSNNSIFSLHNSISCIEN